MDRKAPSALAEIARELPLMLSREEAISVMGISLRTLERAIQTGEIRVVKTTPGRSGRVRIPRGEVVRWMAERLA